MNPCESVSTNWYKLIEDTAEKHDLSVIHIGFNEGKGVYWDLPYRHNLTLYNYIQKDDACACFEKDLKSVPHNSIVIIDFIAQKIITTSAPLVEATACALPSTIRTKWLYLEKPGDLDEILIPYALETLKKHLESPAPQ